MGLDDIDRKLLNLIQGEFPLSREPFADLGRRLDLSGEQVIQRVQSLKSEGIVRQIGPVLEPRSLGYQTTLVAMIVAGSRLGKATQVIGEHPGISHAYLRENRLNLWLTLALPSASDLASEVQHLADLIGAEAVIDLPALRVFKIRVHFDMVGDEEGYVPNTEAGCGGYAHREYPLSSTDRDLINQLQQDLPLVEKPFDAMSACLGMTSSEYLNRCQALRERGIMRRFGASIKHSRVGFVANAMACWKVPSDRVDLVAQKLTAARKVSHCYERKTAPLWPYNLFAMIHGRTRDTCQHIAGKVSGETGLEDYVLLFSSKELKKVRVKYLV